MLGTFTPLPQKSHADIPDDDFRKHIPKYSDANFPKIISLVNKIEEVAKKHNATTGQVTLAFLLAQGDDIVPIPGLGRPLSFVCSVANIKMSQTNSTKNIKYAEENLAALKIKLSPEDIKLIREAIVETELTGDHYPAGMMEQLYGDTPEPSQA